MKKLIFYFLITVIKIRIIEFNLAKRSNLYFVAWVYLCIDFGQENI